MATTLKRFSLVLVLVTLGCSENSPLDPDTQGDVIGDTSVPTFDITWGFVTSTAQLVRESVDPDVCENGWTALVQELNAKGEGALPPLQKDYVNRFETLDNFSSAGEHVFRFLKNIKTLRISLMWPCWIQHQSWRSRMATLISRLQNAGYTIEITLSHHDSYPISLHDATPNFGIANSGWANDNAVSAFTEYAQSVAETLEQILPPGTRVYLINEPVAMLMNSYLGAGSWPPGGKRAGAGFAKAMRNMRDALIDASDIIVDRGWNAGIAKNIRPIMGQSPADKDLDFIFNWWLLEALVSGCIDDDFDQLCDTDDPRPSQIDIVGMTFYGTMHAGNESVEIIGAPGKKSMYLPIMDFTPDAANFDTALRSLVYRFEDTLFTVAEIGFSSGKVDTMGEWLTSYRDALVAFAAEDDRLESAISIHTLFESAEFSSGEWQFHAIEGKCLMDGQSCGPTPWGRRLMDIIKQ